MNQPDEDMLSRRLDLGTGQFVDTSSVDPDTPGCTGGLPLVKRLDRNNPPSKLFLHASQVWVWLNMNPPRWEVRGTGALL